MLDTLLEEAVRRHGLSLERGLQVLRADRLSTAPFEPGLSLLVLPAFGTDGEMEDHGGFRLSALPGRTAHGADAPDVLRSLYPADHPVLGLEGADDATVGSLEPSDLGSPRLLPPLLGEANAASPHGLPWLVARLRAPGGCPWDREQTHLSLRKFLLEESYEVYDALESGSTPELAEELGDLLLQVVLHAEYAAEDGVFDLSDVYRSVVTKIVRRHPHVFGKVDARTSEQVVRNWEAIKAQERAGRAALGRPGTETEPQTAAAFEGLSPSLPALAYAQEMSDRAASLGYDWPDLDGVVDKLREETRELLEAEPEAKADELGDLLLVVVNLARRHGVDAEAALRSANRKFGARFALVESLAAARGTPLRELDPEALDELWESAKAELTKREAATAAAHSRSAARAVP